MEVINSQKSGEESLGDLLRSRVTGVKTRLERRIFGLMVEGSRDLPEALVFVICTEGTLRALEEGPVSCAWSAFFCT